MAIIKASVVDASVMVGVFYPKDPFHEVSKNWFEGHLKVGGVLTAPALLLPEVAGVISRRTGKPELGRRVLQRLEALEELTLVPLDHALNRLAAETSADLGLGGADACYVALAMREGLPLATWDRQQRERSVQQIDVQTPETLLGWTPNERDALYNAMAEAVEKRLQERYPHRTWSVERAAERRCIAIRSQVPMNYGGLTIEGSIEGANFRQSVGVLSVDTMSTVDEAFFEYIAKTIESQFPGLSSHQASTETPRQTIRMHRGDLTDTQWKRLQPLLPPPLPSKRNQEGSPT